VTVKDAKLAAAAALALIAVAAMPGAAHAQPSTRIVGGSAIPITSAPWQVAVLDGNNPTAKALYCGGALIRPRVVLTAAHCVLAPSPFAIHDGANDVIVAGATNWTDSTQGIEDHIAAAVVYPFYNGNPNSGDAALLILDNPVPSAFGTPIKLAGPKEAQLWKAGKSASVSGYGTTAEGGAPSPVLRAATVPILGDSYCNETYPSIFSSTTELCAGFKSGGADACQGDSGGPLTVPARGGDGGFVRQVGIVSFGTGCAEPNAPGVYSRVGSKPLQTFVQDAVNASPDPGGVIGSGGDCTRLGGRKLRLCKCNRKPSPAAKRCKRKVKTQGRGGRA
jgi:secreted trypsin-like serine protease